LWLPELPLTMNEMLARVHAGGDTQRRFVADTSHELRSPLATVMSALQAGVAGPELLGAELAYDTLSPEEQQMRSLVEDLLLLARR
jgi:signal transduction histidine kinase